MIVNELLTLNSYLSMLLNPYGNYVVQKALEQATVEQREQLLKVRAKVTSAESKG